MVSCEEYASTVDTRAPSKYTLAIPTCGPWKPIQLTPVPLKLRMARWPAAKPIAAVPPLHVRSVLPCTHVPAGV